MKQTTMLFCLIFLLSACCQSEKTTEKKIRFAFMTDLHLNQSNGADRWSGWAQALDSVKALDVDFIILGGDLIDVSSGQTNYVAQSTADSMFTVLKQTLDETKIKYYPTIGNHDRYFDAEQGYVGVDEVFSKTFGKSYYTFETNGVQFFILNSVQLSNGNDLYINEKQMEWLKSELQNIPADKPIIVSTHVPVYSIYYPVVEGKYVPIDIITNYKELLKTFEGHNLQLVLQGHQHLYEEIFSQEVQYITGGAVCAGWWGGAFYGTEEGFLLVEVDKDNKISWDYIDFGWTPKD